jgi:hypothetical protein
MNAVSLAGLEASWGVDFSSLVPGIQILESLGYLQFNGNDIVLTERGQYYHADIIKILFHKNPL